MDLEGYIGKYCVIRTYSAGVHVGTLVALKGKHAKLVGARRIWSWCGAKTLSEISQNGVGDGSKIAQEVPQILLTEAIEVIPCSKVAESNLKNYKKWD